MSQQLAGQLVEGITYKLELNVKKDYLTQVAFEELAML